MMGSMGGWEERLRVGLSRAPLLTSEARAPEHRTAGSLERVGRQRECDAGDAGDARDPSSARLSLAPLSLLLTVD